MSGLAALVWQSYDLAGMAAHSILGTLLGIYGLAVGGLLIVAALTAYLLTRRR